MFRDPRRILIAAAALAALATPRAASADDYHVATGGTHGPCTAAAPCDLAYARLIADAHGGHDRLVIDGRLQLTEAIDADYEGEDIDIVGSGATPADTTIVARAGAPAVVLNFSTTVSNLTVSAPSGPALLLDGGTVSDVDVDAPHTDRGAITVIAGTVQRTLVRAPAGIGVVAAGATTLRDLDVAAATGVVAQSTVSVERARIDATSVALSAKNADVAVRDSLLTATTSGATAIFVQQAANVTVSGSTIDGGGAADNGVIVASNDNPGSATIRGSIVRGAATDIAIGPIDTDTARPGKVTVGTSDFATASAGVTGLAGNTDADPLWVDRAAGDYRLQPGSPLIDHSDDQTAAGETDLAGNPRVLDGDGDGTATADIGAYEAPVPAPAVQQPSTDPPADQQQPSPPENPAPVPGTSTPTPMPPHAVMAGLGLASTRLVFDRSGRARVRVSCPAAVKTACKVHLVALTAPGKPRTAGRGSATIAPGKTVAVTLRLTSNARALVRRGTLRKLTLTATAPGTTAVSRLLKLR